MQLQLTAKTALRVALIAAAALIVLFVGAVVLSGAFKGYRQAQYDKIAIPFIKTVVPQMSKWDLELFKSFLWEKARRPEYNEAFMKTVSRYSKIGTLRGIEEPQFLSYEQSSPLKIVAYSVKAHYENGDALITIRLLATDSGFQVFHFNLESPVTNFPTMADQVTGMKKADWLARFKPMEVKGLCTDSPIQRGFKGTYPECTSALDKLFEKCVGSVDNVVIPDVLASREEASKYGSIVGECIAAYYFGGEYLSLFNKAQAAVKK